MNKKLTFIAIAFATLGLTACGSDSDPIVVIDDPEPEPEVGVIQGPFSTGTVQERTFVYYDIDTSSTVELTAEEAATDTTWDIAFKGTGVYLNVNDSDNPVSLYFTGNNSDYFDAEGNAIVDTFINATADGELDDFVAVTSANVPADEEFITDATNGILDGFYNYDSSTHQVTAAADHFFIVNSDTTITKFNVTDLTQDSRVMSALTITYANQLDGATEFDTTTTDLDIDAALECASEDTIYIDFDTNAIVTSTDAWDIKIPCSEDSSGADYTLTLADDATATQDFSNAYDGIPVESIAYYGFKTDQYTDLAFKESPWYQYSLEGNHKIWSQYGVYLIKNANGVFKLQITSYYDTDGNSGNYSFRAEAL